MFWKQLKLSPRADFKFKLTGLKARFNKGVTAQLKEPAPGDTAWTVDIGTRSDKATDIYEVITVKTDNPLKPKLTIRVFATFTAPEKTK